MLTTVAVVCAFPELLPSAERVARQLNTLIVERNKQKEFDFVLEFTPDGLLLLSTHMPELGALSLTYLTGSLGFRFKKNEGKDQPLIKAVGLRGVPSLTVIDVTAGLGRDSLLLAQQGCSVTLVERSPLIFALLEDALERTTGDAYFSFVRARMRWENRDAFQLLNDLVEREFPDVIYLDPMYPHRKKHAAVKKEMRFLRALVGDDIDAGQLLTLALTRARNRVVVKRPKGAEHLADLNPTHSITSPNTRYDVYLIGTSSGKGKS